MTRRSPAFGARPDGSLDRRGFLRTAAGLAAVLGLPPIGAAVAAEPFRIGWVRPTTGRLASSFAPLYVPGLIAIEEINAAGGIMGRPIVRQEEDDEALPAREPAIVRKLQEEGINVICGPTGSSQSLSSLAMTTSAKILQATYANAEELGDGKKYPYHYQCTFNTGQQATVAATYLVETLKARKIGILQESTAFGEQATAATKVALERIGLKPVDIQVYPLNAPDLSPYVRNLQKAGAEGVVAWIANVPNLAMAFNAMASLKWLPPITGHNGLFHDSLFDLVPAEALKNVYGTHYRSLTFTAAETPGERQQEYARRIRAYPETKAAEAAVAGSPHYDFLHLLKHVIEQEKSFETEAIKRALDSVQGYRGMLGTLSFTSERHTGIGLEDIVLGSVASARDARANGVFRERAPGL